MMAECASSLGNDLYHWPLAVSSWSWHQPFYAGRLSLLDVPQAAVSLGFTAVELNDFMLPPPRWSRLRRPLWRLRPHAQPNHWRYTRDNIQRLKMALTRAGVRCIGWTLDTDLTVGEDGWHAQRRYVWRGLSAAASLGAEYLRVTVGGTTDTPADHDTTIVARLRDIGRMRDAGYPSATILVENHWGVSTDCARLVRWVTAAGGAVGLCFDPANLPAEAQGCCWPLLAEHAAHFHMKTRTFTASGNEASISYAELCQILKLSGFCGYWVIEYEGNKDPNDGIHQSKLLYLKLIAGEKNEVEN